MAKARQLEEKLVALEACREDPSSPEATDQIRKALKSKTSFLVAKAAEIVGERERAPFESELTTAFDRLMTDPAKTDKGCKAKTAIANALYQLGSDCEGVFLGGIRHVQMEPVYGGSVDTAAELRGACALGLVRMNHPQAMIELAHLMADSEPPARIAAMRALAYRGDVDAGVPLLHHKAVAGDDEPQVLCECFGALLKLAPQASVPFVAEFLHDGDMLIVEMAAIALGESRIKEALPILKACWQETHDTDLRRTALIALAVMRDDEATEFLLAVIGNEMAADAMNAIAALAMYKHDQRLKERVEQIVAARGDIDLIEAAVKGFEAK